MQKASWPIVQTVCHLALWLQTPGLVRSSPLQLPSLGLQALSQNTSSDYVIDQNVTTIDFPSGISNSWPSLPFVVKDIRTHPTNPEWLDFYAGGNYFSADQTTWIGWDISGLLLRLGELNNSSACPPYSIVNFDTGMILEIQQPAPTVALCIAVISAFEDLVDKYGAREIVFRFGQGFDLTNWRGAFGIGFRTPPSPPGSTEIE